MINTIINKSSLVQTITDGNNWKQVSCVQHNINNRSNRKFRLKGILKWHLK